jgi:hypothetical protein
MTEPTPTHVAMYHAESGGTALFPAGAVDLWRPRGWVPVAELEAAAAEQSEDVPPPADDTTTRPAARKRATDS